MKESSKFNRHLKLIIHPEIRTTIIIIAIACYGIIMRRVRAVPIHVCRGLYGNMHGLLVEYN